MIVVGAEDAGGKVVISRDHPVNHGRWRKR